MDMQCTPVTRGRPKDPTKHDLIMDAARGLFVQRGFHGTSMEALAKKAGVSKATLYSHFADKDALYRALIIDKMQAYQIDNFADHLTWDMRADLTYMARHLLDLIFDAEALDMARMVVSESREGTDLPHLFISTGPRRILAQLKDYLRQQKTRGADYLAAPADDAELFSSLVIGHLPFMFALTKVEPPMSAVQRKKRAASAVQNFLALKNAD